MSTTTFSVRLESENYRRLKELAARRGIPAAKIINDLLSELLPQMARPEVKFIWVKADVFGK